MKFCEIAGKEVINVRNGTLVGFVNDLGFDECNYVIHAIYVRPAQSLVKKIFPWFFPCEEIEIPVNEIENINGDVVLVRFH
ncbi:PRC-barrel domain-containing protein [Amedibacillus sp. YH-ame6]